MADERKARLRDQLDGALTNLMATIPGADNEPGWDAPTTEEGWNVRQTLAHLAIAEKSMHILINRALAAQQSGADPDTLVQRGSDGEPFDVHRWNVRQVEKREGQPASALRVELTEVRTDTLKMIAAFPDDGFDAPAWHPALGNTTVEGIFRIIGIHMKDHTRVIKQALKAGLKGRYWEA